MELSLWYLECGLHTCWTLLCKYHWVYMDPSKIESFSLKVTIEFALRRGCIIFCWHLYCFSTGWGPISNAWELGASCHDGEGFGATTTAYGAQSWVRLLLCLIPSFCIWHGALILCPIFAVVVLTNILEGEHDWIGLMEQLLEKAWGQFANCPGYR